MMNPIKIMICGLALLAFGLAVLLVDRVPFFHSKLPLCSETSFGMCRVKP